MAINLMPIYEYICDDCQEQVNLFFRSFAEVETKPAVCPLCGGSNLERVISRVAVVHTAGGQASQAGSGSLGASDQNDPKALARSWREASRGQDLGKEFNEVGSRLEAGERPESIEKSLRKRFGQKPEVH
jgi:putative FmdB family regulatory protein